VKSHQVDDLYFVQNTKGHQLAGAIPSKSWIAFMSLILTLLSLSPCFQERLAFGRGSLGEHDHQAGVTDLFTKHIHDLNEHTSFYSYYSSKFVSIVHSSFIV
jgi:hypothetical protein